MRYGSFRRFLPLLAGIVAMLGTVAADNALAQEPRFDGVTLTVGTYGGTWKDAIHEKVGTELEKRGAKMQYVPGNPRDLLAKLIASRGREVPFDIVEIVDSTWPEILAGKFVQKLNLTNVPNTRDLDVQMYDEYKVANWITEEGIVYNTEKFKELSIPKPETFSALLNPELKGRVTFPDINVSVAFNGIVGFSADAGGDETNIERGLALIKKLDVTSFWTSTPQVFQMFKSGDVWAAVAHGGHAVRMYDGGIPVGMAYPKVKDRRGMASRGFAGVVMGTKQVAAAEFYINRLISQEAQEVLAVKTGIVPVNKKVLVKLANDSKLMQFLLLSPEEIKNMYYIDFSSVNVGEWSQKWNRVMAK